MRLRAVLASLGAVLLTTVLMPQVAEAQDTPTLTVTPKTGLVDGQPVTVVANGFPYDVNLLLQCPADVDLSDFVADFLRCGGAAPSFVNGVPTSFTVRTTQETVAVVLGVPGPTTLTCGLAPNDCVIVALSFVGTASSIYVTRAVPISFRLAVPTTTADCKHGGWRNLANEGGQPFRSQGQCVSFVVAQDR
jgi:hypothetical protein